MSEFVKGYSSGEELDIRVNKEGSFNILKNDIYALVNTKNEQIKAVETERDSLSDYMADISHQLKTPITSMMIMADLLEEAEPEKQTELLEIFYQINKTHRLDLHHQQILFLSYMHFFSNTRNNLSLQIFTYSPIKYQRSNDNPI